MRIRHGGQLVARLAAMTLLVPVFVVGLSPSSSEAQPVSETSAYVLLTGSDTSVTADDVMRGAAVKGTPARTAMEIPTAKSQHQKMVANAKAGRFVTGGSTLGAASPKG